MHNPVIAHGWINRGEIHVVCTNTGHKRGQHQRRHAFDKREPAVRFDDTINADSSIACSRNGAAAISSPPESTSSGTTPATPTLAPSRSYRDTSRINAIFRPTYAPNLNRIERVWQFFKNKTL